MAHFNWTCPYCGHPQVVTQNAQGHDWMPYVGETTLGNVGTRSVAIACLNAECREVTLNVELRKWRMDGNSTNFIGPVLRTFHLLPESSVKQQPDYIPKALVQDYYEACRIRDLSPKASATLSRRCLQGMIRDFAKISKARLIDEIQALNALVADDKAPRGVTPESVQAIDHVREIGNIGAHMEKDINLIVEIDSDEAQILIELIETLFEEWYVARKKREERFAGIEALNKAKKQQKKGGAS